MNLENQEVVGTSNGRRWAGTKDLKANDIGCENNFFKFKK